MTVNNFLYFLALNLNISAVAALYSNFARINYLRGQVVEEQNKGLIGFAD